MSASATNYNYAMTPPLLTQLWQSYGGSARVKSLTVFSQPDTTHVFSNYSMHPYITMDLPECCCPTSLANSGRLATLSFEFAEKAIMMCKAALFKDYRTFDAIQNCRDSRQAKALGRRVSPFDQQVWDRNQCTIAKHVMVAKLQWKNFRVFLLQTRDDTIAECTAGDSVWGSAIAANDANIYYPGRWRGMNILGWSLMEARDEARRIDQLQLQQLVPIPPQPSAPPAFADTANTAASTATLDDERKKIDPNSIKYLATLYSIGPNAFGPLERSNQNADAAKRLPDISHLVKDIVEASVPEAKNMLGERGIKAVTKMLKDIYDRGLFMHGDAISSVNKTIIPAFRHVVAELNKMDAQHKKRVSMIRDLVEACQDCQQVQARVILRMYGDLTSQNETFESQLKYSLLRSKETALQVLITKYHSPYCDYDHTKVGPVHQRAHLWSGYVALIGNAYGLDGVIAANGDRFLNGCLDVIRNAHNGTNSSNNNNISNNNNNNNRSRSFKRFRFGNGGEDSGIDDDSDQKLKDSLMDALSKTLCVKEWLSNLIGDINNQSSGADRMIDRSCIFSWASANMHGDFKHRVFYDDARSNEYSDLDPKEPTEDNQYEPFLSPIVLVEMLLKAGMLTPKVVTK